MNKFLYLLILLLLLQSCSVYHSGSLAPAAAVAAENKVKVITADQQKYKFKRLEMEGDRLTGIARPGSAAAKELPATPYENQNKLVQVDLSDVEIEKIKLRYNSLSTILNFAIPIALAYTAFLTLVITVQQGN